MSNYPFSVSLNPAVQVTSTEDHYTLHSAESDATDLLTLATTPGIGTALDRLKAGNTTTESLVQALAELEDQAVGQQFALMLQQLDERGWLNYAVLPLAVAIPMVESARLNLSESDWIHTSVGLSPSTSQRPQGGVMVLESPDSEFQVKLLDWRANALLAQLAAPKPLAKVTPPPDLGPETVYQFLNLLRAAGFLTTEDKPSLVVASDSNESMATAVADVSGEKEEVETELNEVDDPLSVTESFQTEALGDEADTVVIEPESVDGDASTPTTETLAVFTDTPIQAEEVTAETTELDALEDQPIEITDTDSSEVQGELDTETEPIALAASTQPTNETEVESSARKMLISLHPHDLDDRIPGLSDLRNQTLGDPRITIVVLDGNPDHTLSCFEGAEVSKVFPYWQETLEPIPPEDYATYREIDGLDLEGDEKAKAMEAAIPESNLMRIHGDNHACHITSEIVGQEHTPVTGLAPNCRVINVPINAVNSIGELISPLNLARAFELALDLEPNIIHCAECRPTQTGEGEELLTQAVKKCQDKNILIVAPAGNDKGRCQCLPAALPGALAVGAMKADGIPYHFSNWGGNYTEEGIMAPGGDILGAQPGTEEPMRKKGTSVAAPLMTGISALLMSLQLQEGKPVDAEAVRTALLNTAIPCDPEVVEEPERCLRGFVNIPGAMKVLFGQPSVTISFAGDQVTRTERASHATATATAAPASIEAAMTDTANSPVVEAASLTTPTEVSVTATTTPAEPTNPATVEASTAFSGHVYALGTLGYDFGDEARRDSFKQLMPPAELDGIMVPADPYDARQMLQYLESNPDEARSLIWTLNLDQNTLYALEPKGPFASDVYEMLLLMLAGQLEPETSDEFVERISVGARRTNRTVELFSGEIVPVVTVYDVRGMYGWTVNALINAALASITNIEPDQEPIVREGIEAFLNRVYYDLHNLGQTSRDRALNFSATNIFQATSVFAEAIASNRRLDTITVKKSPYCRIHSDCWDVLLTFFDPESSLRSRQVFRFTVDVARNMPVTIGTIKRWSIPGNSESEKKWRDFGHKIFEQRDRT